MADLRIPIRIDRTPVDAAIVQLRSLSQAVSECDCELDAPELCAIQAHGALIASRAIQAAIVETRYVRGRPVFT